MQHGSLKRNQYHQKIFVKRQTTNIKGYSFCKVSLNVQRLFTNKLNSYDLVRHLRIQVIHAVHSYFRSVC